MEFIRRVGSQAEVNDGGKIRRLPFSGEGVAPQPGAKVNPGRDACCCPGAVPLKPNQVNETPKNIPRRVASGKPLTNKPFICVPRDWLSLRNVYLPPYLNPEDYTFGGRSPLGSLSGQNIKVCIHPGYGYPLYPLPRYWVEWDIKDNSLGVRELKKTDTLYLLADENTGSYDDIRASHDGQGVFQMPGYPYERMRDDFEIYKLFIINEDFIKGLVKSQPFKIKEKTDLSLLNNTSTYFEGDIRVFQPFRDERKIEDFSKDFGAGMIVRAYQKEMDEPGGYFLRWIKEKKYKGRIYLAKNIVKPLTSRYQMVFRPEDQELINYYQTVNYVFYPFLPKEMVITPKVFLKWYKNPKGFNYERIY